VAQGLCNGQMSDRPSVRLSHRSAGASAASEFAADRPAGRRYRSIAAGCAAGAVQQVPALSSKCG